MRQWVVHTSRNRGQNGSSYHHQRTMTGNELKASYTGLSNPYGKNISDEAHVWRCLQHIWLNATCMTMFLFINHTWTWVRGLTGERTTARCCPHAGCSLVTGEGTTARCCSSRRLFPHDRWGNNSSVLPRIQVVLSWQVREQQLDVAPLAGCSLTSLWCRQFASIFVRTLDDRTLFSNLRKRSLGLLPLYHCPHSITLAARIVG
jgi:hypothetical protein